jgi:hypothetical protein
MIRSVQQHRFDVMIDRDVGRATEGALNAQRGTAAAGERVDRRDGNTERSDRRLQRARRCAAPFGS